MECLFNITNLQMKIGLKLSKRDEEYSNYMNFDYSFQTSKLIHTIS